MDELEGQGSAHPDLHQTFDSRLPLDIFHGDERYWPIYLAVWALLALFAAGLTRALVRRREPSRAFSFPVFAALLTLVPSARDGGLVLAIVGLFAFWLLLVRGTPLPDRVGAAVRAAWQRVADAPAWKFALALGTSALVLDLALGWLAFRWIPVIQDSQAQVFHARLLAEGSFHATAPPLGDFFLAENVVMRDGLWYPIYPPGHLVFLTLGALVGAPFVVNPILGAASCLLIWGAARGPFGESVGRGAGLLCLLSPFVAYMSAEYMNHGSAGAMFALELFAVVRLTSLPAGAPRRSVLGWGALAGVGAGWQLMTKPLTFVALNAAVGLFLLHRTFRGGTERRGEGRLVLALIAMAATAALGGLVQLEFNRRTNGDPLLFGYAVGYPTLRYGFGPSPWGVHTPFRALEYTIRNANALNLYLTGLPIPALGLAILGFVSRREVAHRWLFGAPVAFALLAYAGWCFQDLTFGPRYVYEASLGLFPLVACGLPAALAWAARTPLGDVRALGAGGLAVVIALVSLLPGLGVYYRRVYAQDEGVVAAARRELPPGSLVFVEGKYQRAFFAVDPALDGPHLFARDLGERNAELACLLRDRRAFVEREGRFVPLEPACGLPTQP